MDYIPSIRSSRFGSSNRLSKFSANNLTTDIRRRAKFRSCFVYLYLFVYDAFVWFNLFVCFFRKGWDGMEVNMFWLVFMIIYHLCLKLKLSFHLKFNKTTHIHLHLIDTKYLWNIVEYIDNWTLSYSFVII